MRHGSEASFVGRLPWRAPRRRARWKPCESKVAGAIQLTTTSPVCLGVAVLHKPSGWRRGPPHQVDGEEGLRGDRPPPGWRLVNIQRTLLGSTLSCALRLVYGAPAHAQHSRAGHRWVSASAECLGPRDLADHGAAVADELSKVDLFFT